MASEKKTHDQWMREVEIAVSQFRTMLLERGNFNIRFEQEPVDVPHPGGFRYSLAGPTIKMIVEFTDPAFNERYEKAFAELNE